MVRSKDVSQKLNPQWLRAIQATVNPCPYFQLQRMTIADLAWGESTLTIELENRHMQPFGVVHGGVFATRGQLMQFLFLEMLVFVAILFLGWFWVVKKKALDWEEA